MKVKVKDVSSNPYRNIEHYPLNKDKIIALTQSIEKTGFWDNLVAREVNGKIEIAYGHHRIEALRLAEGFGYDFEFELPIKEIDNGTMIQIMANENMQEWSHSIGVIDETVKVAKKYLENDETFLSGKKASKFKNTKAENGEATGEDIADFLGWGYDKVRVSLKRINLIEDGKLDKKAVESLPSITHAKEFAKSISSSNVEFTPQEQNKIAKEITDSGMGKAQINTTIKAKAFEKKYGSDFGKKKTEKKDKQIKEFDDALGQIADDISSLSDKFLKLTNLKEELKNVTSKKGLFNLKLLFMAFGNLETRMHRFQNAMVKNTEDITEDYLQEVKQLKQ